MKYTINSKFQKNAYECTVLCFCDYDNAKMLLTDCVFSHKPEKCFNKLTDAGDWVWCTELEHNQSVMLFYCGSNTKFNAFLLKKYLMEIVQVLLKQKISSVQINFPLLIDQSVEWEIKQIILQMDSQCYINNNFKTLNKQKLYLQHVNVCMQHDNNNEKLLKFIQAINSGVNFTRYLADLPANHCTPSLLAAEAEKLSIRYSSIKINVMDYNAIKQLKMGALLAVAQGSIEPPKFIEIIYRGIDGNIDAPIILIGKGITFDSGGISIKPSNNMEEMKYDMSGAAGVLGAIKACAELKLPLNIIGLIPSAENMPSGSAIKPGDVVTSMSGQTIEITNTDAEGRLILADALTYAEKYKPEFVIDIATLTGAIVIALGHVMTGFMTQDEILAKLISQAGMAINDKIWRMPLDDEYQEIMDSPIADMWNSSMDRGAGSITAAAFLSRFTKKYRWAHLDIAGTAWNGSCKERHATGRPVPLLVELLHYIANQ